MAAITIAELVRNGTMSAAIAGLLWAAVDEQVSFLTVAVPRLAGKSTTAQAVLALRRPDVPLHEVLGDAAELERLRRERLGGYIVVGEFSRAPMPGYIWGEPVRQVFETLDAGYALQTSLHAPSAEAAIEQITAGCGVDDERAGAVKLVVYIEMFGRTWAEVKRRVVDVYEVRSVEGGRPKGVSLFGWREADDAFEKLADAALFARDAADLQLRATTIADLAASGRTSEADVGAAVAAYRMSRGG